MYCHRPRDSKYISELQDFLKNKYGFSILNFEKAARSYYGENWKLTDPDGEYFVKLDYSKTHQEIYASSFPVLDYIHRCGNNDILKIKKTISNELFLRYDGAVLGVFDFVRGKISKDYPPSALLRKLAKIYQSTRQIAHSGIFIQIEAFDTKQTDLLKANLKQLEQNSDLTTSLKLFELFKTHSDLVKTCQDKLVLYSNQCRHDLSGFYLTHGDPWGNIMVEGEKTTLVDWDYPMWAPIERDAWFFFPREGFMDQSRALLKDLGIPNPLQMNRILYYTYFTFLSYSNELLHCFFEMETDERREAVIQLIDRFLFKGWIKTTLLAAESLRSKALE